MDKAEKFWDRAAKNSDEKTERYDEAYIKIVDRIKKYLSPDKIVLDYGCGTGKITSKIAGDVKNIYGIDISSGMIRKAKGKAEYLNITNINFLHTTIFDDKLPTGSFDMITAINILHLLEDRGKTVKRIYELLKPGGIFISSTACLSEKRSFLSLIVFFFGKTGIVPHVKNLKFSQLKNLVSDKYFEILETEKIAEDPPNLFIASRKKQTL